MKRAVFILMVLAVPIVSGQVVMIDVAPELAYNAPYWETFNEKSQFPCDQGVDSSNLEGGFLLGGSTNQRLAVDIDIDPDVIFHVETIIINAIIETGTPATDFDVIFYDNDAQDLPGTQIGTQTGLNIVGSTYVATNSDNTLEWYDYELDLNTPFSLDGDTGGEKYWMEIETDAVGWGQTSAVFEGLPGTFYNDNTAGAWNYVITDQSGDGTPDTNHELIYVLEGDCETGCLPPDGFSATNVTTATADIHWDPSPTETDGYSWAVVNNGEHPDTHTPIDQGTVGTGVTTASVSGLSSETLYHFYVKTDCGAVDGESSWGGNGTIFTPAMDCHTPVAPQASASGTSVTVTWTEPSPAPADGYYWELYYGADDPQTDPSLDSGNEAAGATSTEITGLEEETAYQILLFSVCDEGGSVMSNPMALQFSTGTVSIDDNPIPGFSFYPNPADKVVNILADTIIDSISVYTLTGRQVLENETDGHIGKIDLSGLASGLYLMKVTSGGQTGIYRVVKK